MIRFRLLRSDNPYAPKPSFLLGSGWFNISQASPFRAGEKGLKLKNESDRSVRLQDKGWCRAAVVLLAG
jgi:hypothetical protein